MQGESESFGKTSKLQDVAVGPGTADMGIHKMTATVEAKHQRARRKIGGQRDWFRSVVL